MYVSVTIRNVINWHTHPQLGWPRRRCIDLAQCPLHMRIPSSNIIICVIALVPGTEAACVLCDIQ